MKLYFVSISMFLNTVNHLGLQEDTHYCPNATCWCVNCQLICMQKVHLSNVPIFLHIYEEGIQIDVSTCPNAVDKSTVSSSVCRRSTFGLLPVEDMVIFYVCCEGDCTWYMFVTSWHRWSLLSFRIFQNPGKTFSV